MLDSLRGVIGYLYLPAGPGLSPGSRFWYIGYGVACVPPVPITRSFFIPGQVSIMNNESVVAPTR